MLNNKLLLEQFRDLQISKEDLYSKLPKNTKIKENEMVEVSSKNLINLLENYKKSQVTAQDFLDWVNIVWFSDWYEYNKKNSNSMASVIDQLEEADEDISKLSEENINRYIDVLKNNIELD